MRVSSRVSGALIPRRDGVADGYRAALRALVFRKSLPYRGLPRSTTAATIAVEIPQTAREAA